MIRIDHGGGKTCAHRDRGRGPVLDEETFRYLLAVERARTDRSSRPFVLVLVDAVSETARLDAALARRLFPALAGCLRETDFLGWYRQGEVAGAVLTELGPGPLSTVTTQIRQRLDQALRGGLRQDELRRLRVQVQRCSDPVAAGPSPDLAGRSTAIDPLVTLTAPGESTC